MATYSVIIPWCDRPQLALSLRGNATLFEKHAAEVIIVNAGGNCRDLEKMVRQDGVGRARVLDLVDATFNWSLCHNLGAFASRGRYVLLLDGDIVLDSDIFELAARHLQQGCCYIALGPLQESDPAIRKRYQGSDWTFLAALNHTLEYVTIDGRRAVFDKKSRGGVHGGDGVVLVDKQDLVRVGGLNSEFRGFGYEDTDFQLRLQFMLGLQRIELGEGTHLSHPATDTRESFVHNVAVATCNYSRGNYLGSLQSDLAAWADKVLDLPCAAD